MRFKKEIKVSIDSNILILSSRDYGRKLVFKNRFFDQPVFDLVEKYPKQKLSKEQQNEYDCLKILLKDQNIIFYKSLYIDFEVNFRRPDSIRNNLFDDEYKVKFETLICPFKYQTIIFRDPMEGFCLFLKETNWIDPIIKELSLVKDKIEKNSTFFDCYLLLEMRYNNMDYFLTNDGPLIRKTENSDKFKNKILYPSKLLKIMEDN